ncbi:interleukin-5 receptor subunit alpha [Ascaphus truei]|uniref:interleukin-5 receptor subunit alpha n=1 Tax=Ascaphus truei TaxID=8439 RepID=UPI003F59AD66
MEAEGVNTSCHPNLKLATYNWRLFSEAALQELEGKLEKITLNIVGLSEVRIKDKGLSELRTHQQYYITGVQKIDGVFVINMKLSNNNHPVLTGCPVQTVTVRNTEFVQGPLQEPLSQHSLQVRAVGITHCRKTALRSQWSEALFIGTTSWDRPEAEYVIALSVCLTVAGLVLMLVCVRFHFWRKLFPRVPRPRNGLKDLFLNTDMRSDTSEFDGEVVSYIEEIEEFRSEKFFQ